MYIGSCVPLVIYVFWLLCTLGVVSQPELTDNPSLSNLIASLAATLSSDRLSLIVGLFADLALVTSFLGVSLGLFEFLLDSTKKRFNGNRFFVALLTYLPPLAFALFYPEGFIMALGYAAIALVILAVFLPVAMVFQSRKQCAYAPNRYQVKGGSIGLILSGSLGVLIIVSQFLVSMGVI